MLFAICRCDLIRTARSGRHTMLRSVYVAVLLAVLLQLYGVWLYGHNKSSWDIWDARSLPGHEIADFAATYFYVFTALQLLVVLLLTPPYVAGAIAEERERGTLEALFATHLRNDQIVLGLLLSRLARLGMIVLAGLPILSVLQFLGGIDPNLVLAVFVVTGMSALSLSCLAMLFSIYAGKARRAILQTELIAVGYLFLSTLLEIVTTFAGAFGRGAALTATVIPAFHVGQHFDCSGYTLGEILGWPGLANPIVMSYRLYGRAATSTQIGSIIWDVLATYCTTHGVIAFTCILWAVLRLRAVALRDLSPSAGQMTGRRRVSHLRRWWHRVLSDQPLLWKGLVIDARSHRRWVASLALGVPLAALFWPPIHVACGYGRLLPAAGNQDGFAWLMNDWCRIATSVIACIMLMVVAMRSAGSISLERERQTLDSLFATPLRNRTILLGKWLGSFLYVPRWWLCLGTVWLLGIATRALHPAAVPCLMLVWLAQAAFVSALGVWFSAVSPSTRRAVLATVAMTVIFVMLLSATALHLTIRPNWTPLEAAGIVPPVTFGLLAFPPAEFQDWLDGKLDYHTLRFLQEHLLGAAATAVILVLVALDFRRATGRREGTAPPANLPPINAGTAATDDATWSPPLVSWRQRLKHGLLLLLPLCLLLACYWAVHVAAENMLSDTMTELDRVDPHWRIEEIDAHRRVLPDAVNSALRVLEADRLLPGEWGNNPSFDRPEANPIPTHLLPNEVLSKRQAENISRALHSTQEALATARTLAGMPKGRFSVNWGKLGFDTTLPHITPMRRVRTLLELDAFDRAQKNDGDGALETCRALLNLGRAIGDEPLMISQVFRASIRMDAVHGIERTLAQGQPSPKVMESLQRLLEEDEREPLMYYAFRGERAAVDRLLEALRLGNTNLPSGYLYPTRQGYGQWSEAAFVTAIPGSIKLQRAAMLDVYTEAVEIARLPPEKWKAKLANLRPPRYYPLLWYVFAALQHHADSHQLRMAEERSAIAALAAERYRRDRGRWPEKLATLVPAYLTKVPTDPFTGKPLLYRILPDGAVIYSVGRDLADDGGKLARDNWWVAGVDIGVQLWNVDKRRQPSTGGVPLPQGVRQMDTVTPPSSSNPKPN
jgi:ABC-type transport system involved in multi-copper enzyme maturation permease subunit